MAHETADVVVVGAGPVGSVAALAHARQGRRVWLMEAQPARKNRFAGELIHPPAVKILRSLGIEKIPPFGGHGPNRGFALFDNRLGREAVLDTPDAVGASFEFNTFVKVLRDAAIAHERVRWCPRWRVLSVTPEGRVTCQDPEGQVRVVRAVRVIGADGKFSRVRKSLGFDVERIPLSHMVGLHLKGVSLPHEGYGHVMLGEMGPVLAYRIEEDGVRICIDVPQDLKRRPNAEELIWQAIEPQLVPELKAPIHQALMNREVVWAVNSLTPRVNYGEGVVALVGDAVGHCHPMTGIGMTLGFTDAMTLAESATLEEYAERRRKTSLSPSLLATALYEIFTVQAPATQSLRKAIFDLWEYKPKLRGVTMNFLTCTDTRMSHLLVVGAQMVMRAAVHVGRDTASRGAWSQGLDSGKGLIGLVKWLLSESVPPSMQLVGKKGPSKTPFEELRMVSASKG